MKVRTLSRVLAAAAFLAFGAGAGEAALKLLATTTMLADMAKNLGGDVLEVTALMGPGVDPHLYQAGAGDVKALQSADIVLYQGLNLEGKMGDLFAGLTGMGKKVICVADGLNKDELLKDEDHPQFFDPHIWFDPQLWGKATAYVASRLSEYDDGHSAVYEANNRVYQQQLNRLDRELKGKIESIPARSRVMVTAHDAFRYFGRHYGFEVRGLQGVSTETEAGTADVSALAQFIADRRIKALFIETSVPPKNIRALQAAVKARGFDVRLGGELYSDSLGDRSSGHDTYLTTLEANVDTLVKALK